MDLFGDSDIAATAYYLQNSQFLNDLQRTCDLISYGDPGKEYAYFNYDYLV